MTDSIHDSRLRVAPPAQPLRPRLEPEDRRFAAGEEDYFSKLAFRVKEGRKKDGDLVLEWWTSDGWVPIGYEVLGYLIDFFYENEHWLYPPPLMGGEKLRQFITQAVRDGWRSAAMGLRAEKRRAAEGRSMAANTLQWDDSEEET